jgi:hypothetical protein
MKREKSQSSEHEKTIKEESRTTMVRVSKERRPQRRRVFAAAALLVCIIAGFTAVKDEASFLKQYETANDFAPDVLASRWSTASSTADEHDQRDPKDQPRILVVYAGPTDLMNPIIPPEKYTLIPQIKLYKYHLNTDYFLKYGVQCKTQDTLFVLTNETFVFYEKRIQSMDIECRRKYKSRVLIQIRENKCLDLEAVRASVFGGVVNVTNYDYFFYVNCGVSGPAKELANTPWTDYFVQKLNDKVKMTGLSHNCLNPHIQSMMYAMDKEALQLLLAKDVIFDCLERWPDFYDLAPGVSHGRIVNGYERKMSEVLLNAGFAIDPYLRSQAVFGHNKSGCTGKDLWLGSYLKDEFDGRIPLLNETIFFKSTRYMSPELAEEIGYNAPIIGNWV